MLSYYILTLPSEGLLEAQKLEVTTNLPNFESTTWFGGLHGMKMATSEAVRNFVKLPVFRV